MYQQVWFEEMTCKILRMFVHQKCKAKEVMCIFCYHYNISEYFIVCSFQLLSKNMKTLCSLCSTTTLYHLSHFRREVRSIRTKPHVYVSTCRVAPNFIVIYDDILHKLVTILSIQRHHSRPSSREREPWQLAQSARTHQIGEFLCHPGPPFIRN